MANETLEQRVAALEKTLADIQSQISRLSPVVKDNWLPAVLGRFKDNPDYEEVVRLGREFREGRLPEDESPQNPVGS